MSQKNKKSIWNKRKEKIEDNYDYDECADDDFMQEENAEDELAGQIQQKLGISRAEARNIVRNTELFKSMMR